MPDRFQVRIGHHSLNPGARLGPAPWPLSALPILAVFEAQEKPLSSSLVVFLQAPGGQALASYLPVSAVLFWVVPWPLASARSSTARAGVPWVLRAGFFRLFQALVLVALTQAALLPLEPRVEVRVVSAAAGAFHGRPCHRLRRWGGRRAAPSGQEARKAAAPRHKAPGERGHLRLLHAAVWKG
jgi:hypothetical protein